MQIQHQIFPKRILIDKKLQNSLLKANKKPQQFIINSFPFGNTEVKSNLIINL